MSLEKPCVEERGNALGEAARDVAKRSGISVEWGRGGGRRRRCVFVNHQDSISVVAVAGVALEREAFRGHGNVRVVVSADDNGW